MSMVAVCEIEDCGVIAVGRCSACGDAFCRTHQAVYVSSSVPVRDGCSRCSAQKLAEVQAEEERVRSERERTIHELSEIPHPIERLVRTVGVFARVANKHDDDRSFSHTEITLTDGITDAATRDAILALASRDREVHTTGHIASWFAAYSLDNGLDAKAVTWPVPEYNTPLDRLLRMHRDRDGYLIEHGHPLTALEMGRARTGPTVLGWTVGPPYTIQQRTGRGGARLRSLYIKRDGSYYIGPRRYIKSSRMILDEGAIHIGHLLEMARIFGFAHRG